MLSNVWTTWAWWHHKIIGNSTVLTTNYCSRRSTDSASAVSCCLGSKTIKLLTVSKGSPFSGSTLNLSLCYQVCGKDQYLVHSCSSYMQMIFLTCVLNICCSLCWRSEVLSVNRSIQLRGYYLLPEMLSDFTSPINYPMSKLRRWKLRRTLGF